MSNTRSNDSQAPAVIDIEGASPAPLDAWNKVRRYAEHAALFQRASLACQIMAGFELIALRDSSKAKAGRRPAGNVSGSRTHSGEGFQAEVEKLGGISRSTAYEWMEMAKAAKPRLARGDFDLAAVLEKSPASLTPAEQELLKKAVHKISDGRTQLHFMLECGVTKAPQGSAAKGGNTRAAGDGAAAEGGEGTDAATAETAPVDGWEPRAKSLNNLLVEALGDGWWNECHEAQRRELHGNLLDALNAVAASLKPKA